MKTRNIIMAVVVALIFVVAGGSILSRWTGLWPADEPGFMNVDRSWDHATLTVSCAPYMPDDGSGCGTAENTVEGVNERLGYPAFLWTTPGDGDADITMTIGVPIEAGWVDPGGVALLRWSGNTYVNCGIETSNTGTLELLALTIEHELSHCLGLDHDCYLGSIMCGGDCCTLSPTPMGSFPPRISDFDRDLLRERYGP